MNTQTESGKMSYRAIGPIFYTSVGPNLALNRPVWQISDYDVSTGEEAVDGNPNPNSAGQSCTHTGTADNPWWVVDLGGDYKVSSVKITNRLEPDCAGFWDCCECSCNIHIIWWWGFKLCLVCCKISWIAITINIQHVDGQQ